eukprot:scaffold10537_cov122-Isochrysis_galbana.AAC.25
MEFQTLKKTYHSCMGLLDNLIGLDNLDSLESADTPFARLRNMSPRVLRRIAAVVAVAEERNRAEEKKAAIVESKVVHELNKPRRDEPAACTVANIS